MMAAEEEEEEGQMSDNDVPENVHNRLLGAISNLYKQKRVKAPVRNESSLRVSEFHLTSVRPEDKKSGRIELSELARVLEKKAGHTEINEQIKRAKKRTRRLPKPLEKPQAERLERSVGYENLKKDLNKWDPIVYHQRVAEQVSFPLKEPKILVHKDPNDFLTTFKTPTELELKLAESLNSSELLKKEKEEEELEHFKLSLEEIKERRSLMARLRAQLSYKEAKAARQNKIKSKKFHRIQRKDKIKMQIKEFEELQKTDPEAALKKLEQLEKARALERASLRHRTTGQWARNLAVRAKYNKEARIALSEQLAKSKELTQKLKANSDSENENMSEEDEENDSPNDASNSWLSKEPANEVQQFYADYKKFEEEKEGVKEISKKEELELSGKSRGVNSHDGNVPQHARNCKSVNSETSFTTGAENVTNNNKDFEIHQVNGSLSNKDVNSSKPKKTKRVSDKEPIINNGISANDSVVEIEFSVLRNTPKRVISDNKKSSQKDCFGKSKPVKRKLPLNTGTWCVTEVKKNNILKGNRSSKSKTKRNLQKTAAGSNYVEVHNNNKEELNFDDMFYEVEEKLNSEVKNKVEKLKRIIDTENTKGQDNHLHEEEYDDENKNDNSYLKMKKRTVQSEIDEELIETPSSNLNDVKENSVQTLIEKPSVSKSIDSDTNKKSLNIEPNNFFYAKPKLLNTEVPSSLANAEDNLDDLEDEDKTNEKSMTISEAFACDDVDAEFKQDKEEEIKQSQVEDVNLVLPGWGSWGGPNVRVPKRKKRRFIIKFPKKMPRRDENKGNVVINEDKDEKIKPHLVTELPFPFTSVKEYEASIRAPVGGTFLPQSAHRKLIAPTVSTKLGTVIEPMTKDQILKNQGEWK